MALVIFNLKYIFTQYFTEFIVYFTVRYTGDYILSSQYILTFEQVGRCTRGLSI